MKFTMSIICTALAFSNSALAETIVCSYQGYLDATERGQGFQTPVIVEFKIEKDVAIETDKIFGSKGVEWKVAANSEEALVLIRPTGLSNQEARAARKPGVDPAVGAYVFVINRKEGKMARQNVFVNDAGNAYRSGTCIFRAK